MTKIKLSSKQKEVIKKMREGKIFTLLGCDGIKLQYSKQIELISIGIMKSTKANEFIYELTELGKTIQL